MGEYCHCESPNVLNVSKGGFLTCKNCGGIYKETESLRKQIEELNDQLGEARGRIAEKDAEIERLNKYYDASQYSNAEKDKEIESLTEDVHAFHEEIEAQDKEIERLIQKEITEHTALIDKIAEKDKEIERLKEEHKIIVAVLIDELEGALSFYADPQSHPLKGEWSEGYPGGVTYDIGKDCVLDTGQIAQEALQSIKNNNSI